MQGMVVGVIGKEPNETVNCGQPRNFYRDSLAR